MERLSVVTGDRVFELGLGLVQAEAGSYWRCLSG